MNTLEYILIGASGLLLIGIIILIICISHKKKKRNKKSNEVIDHIINAIGGIENIIECSYQLSRLQLVLNNYELVDKTKLKELGVSGIVKTSKKITLVVGNIAREITDKINKR